VIEIPVFIADEENLEEAQLKDFEKALLESLALLDGDYKTKMLDMFFRPPANVPLLCFGKPSPELVQAGVQICPGPSVAQVLGTPHGLEQLRRALRLWKMMTEGQVEDPFYQYDLVDPQPDRQGQSLKEYRKAFGYFQAEVRKSPFIVVDIETSGDIREDEPEDTELISVSVLIPNPFNQIGYRIAVWTDDALNDPYCRIRLAMILTSGVPTVWHNGQYDVKWLNNRIKDELQGQVLKPDDDTFLLHYAMFPGATGGHKLKPLCRQLLGAPEWESGLSKYTIEGGHFERIPGNLLFAYNAGDVYWTWKLRALLHQWLAEGPEGPRKLYYETLLPASRMFVDIESTDAGWPVDLELLHTQQVIHQSKTGKQLAKFRMAVGDPTPFLSDAHAKQRAAWLAKGTPLRDRDHQFNPRSWQQIQKYLRSQGIDVPSTDEETLTELMQSGCPKKIEKFLHRLLDYRHIAKMDENYITGVLKKQRNGRARPRFTVPGTVTGRLTSWIHTVPRPDPTEPGSEVYRAVFTADPGEVVVGVDYGQIETRIVAELCGDPQMIDDLQEGRPDFFSVLMPSCFPRDFRTLNDVWKLKERDQGLYKAKRNQVKPISHGANYKRQAPAMAKQLGIPLRDAYTMFNAYMARYPLLREWQEETMSYVRGDAIDPLWGVPGLWTPFGRRFQQGVITKKNGWSIENAAIAFKPQSIGSDICLTAAISLHEKLHLYKARLVNSQHDALYAVAPEDYAEPVLKLMQKEMRESAAKVFSRVPFITEGHIGKNWAEAA
jgi:DNA polymerase I-like protein with 3'-5' exonuclease and polymerase domains